MEDNICGDVHNNCGDDCEQIHVSSGAGGQKKIPVEKFVARIASQRRGTDRNGKSCEQWTKDD